MVKKVVLKNDKGTTVMPITRGELVLDSSGNPALHSSQFLATDSLPGLLGSSCVFNTTHFMLNTDWKPSGFILSSDNQFISGLYLIKILTEDLIYSGTASVFVGNVSTDDEIVLHLCGKYSNNLNVLGRIYAKIAPSQTSDYGEIYLSTNVSQLAVSDLSITMKKLL